MKYIERIAFILTIVGAILYLPLPAVAPYVFAVGCALLLGTHMAARYQGNDLRQKRNNRTRHLVGVFYAVAGYYMFQPGMYWLPLLTIAVVLELYTLHVMGKDK